MIIDIASVTAVRQRVPPHVAPVNPPKSIDPPMILGRRRTADSTVDLLPRRYIQVKSPIRPKFSVTIELGYITKIHLYTVLEHSRSNSN